MLLQPINLFFFRHADDGPSFRSTQTCLSLGRPGMDPLTRLVVCRMPPLSAPKTGRQTHSSSCQAGKEESMKQLSTQTLTASPEVN